MTSVTVRPLQLDDFPLLHTWMNEPHLLRFYMRDAIALPAVAAKFTPRVEQNHPCICLIAESEGQPFGYAQWYLNRDYPDYGIATLDRNEGVSIDYFIGVPQKIGHGLGSSMLRALVADALPKLAPADRIFYIGHDNLNARAIACTRRAGFVEAGPFETEGVACRLYIRDEQNGDNRG